MLVGDGARDRNWVDITFVARSGQAKLNRRRLWMSVEVKVEPRRDVEGNWHTQTLSYWYSVFGDERGSEEWLAYHYHPASGIPAPHLHVNADTDWASKGLRRRHLPTGRVSLEDFVQMLVEEFGVAPRRSGWKRDLDRSRRVFAQRSELVKRS